MDGLNLGAGNRILPNAVNHDLTKHRPEIDVTHDLNDLPWPWPDESFDEITAWAVFEHLEITLLEAMDECWRILRPGGRIHAKVPYWNSEASYNDPTHRWVFGLDIFNVFDPSTYRGQQFGFYTDRKWTIEHVELNEPGTCVVGRLRKGT